LAYACIDVGSNTTRLLVADVEDGRLRELMSQRVFTRLGRGLGSGGKIPSPKIAETAEVVCTQVRHARDLGVKKIAVVGTAAIRQAKNGAKLVAAVEKESGLPMQVLSDEEEARLAFVGATKTLGAPVEGSVAVVDVGGGSTELAVGTVAGGATWSASFRIGSGFLADSYLRSDPPSVKELKAVRQHVEGTFEGLDVPPVDSAVAVGGSATSLRRLVGGELEHETLERSIRILSSTPVAEVAQRFELEPERVRLLPAGMLILEEVSDRLGLPLKIGRGGLREGVILELLAR
jgi:exopolyphosphatase/guanosine-5'-triphosphate,3'-diphosphate pyrophosphatase